MTRAATASAPSGDFTARLENVAADIHALLDRLLAATPEDDEAARPDRLLAAMRYAALSGGKRLRPFLVVESAALFDVPRPRALMTGAALECVHAYSLIHDDLPVMDNAPLRRGRPSTHAAFDEATAILAGDSLLTFAFDVLARPQTHPDALVRVALVANLARAAGLGGMAGGQMLDLTAEGRFGGAATVPDEAHIMQLQGMKTGALLRFACHAGGILGGADATARSALDRYGRALGQAFQIRDDLLDSAGDATVLGKPTGSDAAAGKATLVGRLGVNAARERLAALVAEAEAALFSFGAAAGILRQAARFVAERRS